MKKAESKPRIVRYRRNRNAIFKSLKDAIVSVDNNMQVVEADKKIKNICDYSPEKIVGKKVIKIKTQCNTSCIYVLKEILKTKHSMSGFRSECMHRDQPNQSALLTGSPVKD